MELTCEFLPLPEFVRRSINPSCATSPEQCDNHFTGQS